MKRKIKAGTTSRKERILVTNNSTGEGLTGLTFNSDGLTCAYIRDGDAAATSIPLRDATVGTFLASGFKEVSSTLMPGVYEFGIPDPVLATGSNCANLIFKGATNMAFVPIEIELDAIDYQTSVQDSVWNAPASGYPTANTFGSGLNNLIQPFYFANIKYVKDTLNTRDEFTVSWYKNNIPVTSGDIQSPAISLINTSDGTSIFQNQTLNYASTNLGVLRYNQTTVSNLTASGEPYLVRTSGTIDGGTRVWTNLIGVDSL